MCFFSLTMPKGGFTKTSSVGNSSFRQFTVNVKGTSVTITHNLNDKYLVIGSF